MSDQIQNKQWYRVSYLTTKKPPKSPIFTLKDLFPGESDLVDDFQVFKHDPPEASQEVSNYD